MLDAVRKVASGGRAISQELAEQLVFERDARADAAPWELLSDREYEIFLHLIKGERLSAIAETLHLSPKTVSTHKMRILRKLELKSAAELVCYAMEHGLLS
nr:response regulator transcription factor [Thiorhodococcus minor]